MSHGMLTTGGAVHKIQHVTLGANSSLGQTQSSGTFMEPISQLKA